mgnify:FL=1
MLGSALGPFEQELLDAQRNPSGAIIERVGENLNKLKRADGSTVFFDDFGNIVE